MPNFTHLSKLVLPVAVTVAIGIGTAFSAQSLIVDEVDDVLDSSGYVMDDDYRPGEFGIDFAAITGPRAPTSFKFRSGACDLTAWLSTPSQCLDAGNRRPLPPAPIVE